MKVLDLVGRVIEEGENSRLQLLNSGVVSHTYMMDEIKHVDFYSPYEWRKLTEISKVVPVFVM